MQNSGSQPSSSGEDSCPPSRWPWLVGATCLLIVLIAIFLPRPNSNSSASAVGSANPFASSIGANSPGERSVRDPQLHSTAGPALTAEEIVAGKVGQFGRSRREIVRAIGRRLRKDVPPEVEKFFD